VGRRRARARFAAKRRPRELVTRPAPGRPSESEHARSREWRTGICGRLPNQGGMRIRAGVAPAAARLESSWDGPDCDFACAISDPEPSPQPHRDVRKPSFAGFCDPRPDRSRHHVINGGAARRSCGPWAIGTSFGTLRTSVARSRSCCAQPYDKKQPDSQLFPAMARPGLEPVRTMSPVMGMDAVTAAMARPGLEPGTPRFSGTPRAAGWLSKAPANCLAVKSSCKLPAFLRVSAAGDAVGWGRFEDVWDSRADSSPAGERLSARCGGSLQRRGRARPGAATAGVRRARSG
jgi:hypothetical protein